MINRTLKAAKNSPNAVASSGMKDSKAAPGKDLRKSQMQAQKRVTFSSKQKEGATKTAAATVLKKQAEVTKPLPTFFDKIDAVSNEVVSEGGISAPDNSMAQLPALNAAFERVDPLSHSVWVPTHHEQEQRAAEELQRLKAEKEKYRERAEDAESKLFESAISNSAAVKALENELACSLMRSQMAEAVQEELDDLRKATNPNHLRNLEKKIQKLSNTKVDLLKELEYQSQTMRELGDLEKRHTRALKNFTRMVEEMKTEEQALHTDISKLEGHAKRKADAMSKALKYLDSKAEAIRMEHEYTKALQKEVSGLKVTREEVKEKKAKAAKSAKKTKEAKEVKEAKEAKDEKETRGSKETKTSAEPKENTGGKRRLDVFEKIVKKGTEEKDAK